MATKDMLLKMLDWIFAHTDAESQADVARRAGVSPTSITRIKNDHVKKPDEETLRKINNAFGGVFNPDWMRGQSDVMLMADLAPAHEPVSTDLHEFQQAGMPDYSSMVNAIIAAKDEANAALRGQVSDLRQQVIDLRQQVSDLRRALSEARRNPLDGYPFAPGAAESVTKQKRERA